LPGNIAGKRVQQFHETGSIRKKWKNRVPVALIYPNRYGLGMSNLGFQLVYHLLNQNDSVVAERVFFPEKEAQPLSRESGRPLADFPLLFFSVSFEHDYQHLVMMLKMAGIAPLASERAGKGGKIAALAAKGQPLVVAGGVATFMNPEPLAPFVDLFIVGEAEPVLGPVMERILSSIGAEDREELLAALGATVPGCYPPALYQVTYDADGTLLENKPRARYDGLPDRISKVQMDSPGSAAPTRRFFLPGRNFPISSWLSWEGVAAAAAGFVPPASSTVPPGSGAPKQLSTPLTPGLKRPRGLVFSVWKWPAHKTLPPSRNISPARTVLCPFPPCGPTSSIHRF
jgi:hypothetical protein